MKKRDDIFNIKLSLKTLLGVMLAAFMLIPEEASAQERSRMRMSFQKDNQGDKHLTITLYAGRGRNMVFLEDATISLTAANNDTTVHLADLTTNSEGVAKLKIEEGYRFPLDEEGFTIIDASYEGTDEYRSASTDIGIKDLNFELNFDIVDSVKTVSVRATEKDSLGNDVPVDGLYMYIGVQRLFSILPVGEVYSSEDGVYSIELPDDIPGDSAGNYTVVARIEDNEYYGSVQKRGEIQWGIPVSFEPRPLPRKLWTDEAPLWMIFSVFIILTGAWFHFFYSIFKLSKIKKVAGEAAA